MEQAGAVRTSARRRGAAVQGDLALSVTGLAASALLVGGASVPVGMERRPGSGRRGRSSLGRRGRPAAGRQARWSRRSGRRRRRRCIGRSGRRRRRGVETTTRGSARRRSTGRPRPRWPRWRRCGEGRAGPAATSSSAAMAAAPQRARPPTAGTGTAAPILVQAAKPSTMTVVTGAKPGNRVLGRRHACHPRADTAPTGGRTPRLRWVEILASTIFVFAVIRHDHAQMAATTATRGRPTPRCLKSPPPRVLPPNRVSPGPHGRRPHPLR